jgi:hypothetical protein
MMSPLSAQVATTPAIEIFSAPGATQTFTVTVPSGTALGSFSVLTLGAPNLDFNAVPAGTTCPVVTAGSCTIEVQFQPTVAGRRQGSVVLIDPSGNVLLTVSLDGAGSGPIAAFAPGAISTFAGNGTGGDGGPATSAELAGPSGVAVDGFGNHYIADAIGNKVRMVTPAGVISTFAGTGTAGFSGDNGPAASAELNGPMSVIVDGAGFVYIADTGNNVVRVVNTAGIISTYAGQYYLPGTTPPSVCAAATNSVGDGCPGNQIILNTPVDLVFCHAQNLHISDKLNNRVRTVMKVGYQTITQVGDGTAGYNGDGELNTSAELNGPTGMDMDAANYIYVADTGNHIIRKTLLTGTVPNPISTVAGTPGSAGYLGDGGLATSAELNNPSSVKVDAAGDIYISDNESEVIRKVNSANGLISTIAGTSNAGYSGDGGSPGGAQLNAPSGILLDENGNIYIADSHNAVVRKVDVADAPSLTFASSPVGVATAPQDVTVLNLGSAPLSITQIGTAASFSLGDPDTSCHSGQSLNAAVSCVLGIEFLPATIGSVSGSVVLTDNANPASQTITLTGAGSQLNQTITFPNPGTLTYGVAPITLAASASSSLPVSYTVISGPATVSGSTLAITGAGSVTVQATQSGGANYAAATPVSVTFTVNEEVEAYTLMAQMPSVSVTAGSSGTETLTLSSSNYSGTVSFATSVVSTDGTAANVTASATPVTLTPGGTGTSTVMIAANTNAANHPRPVPWKSSGTVMFCAVLLGVPLIFRRKHMIAVLLCVMAISLAGLLTACSGGSNSMKVSAPTTARTYVVTVTPTGTASPAGSVAVTNPSPVTVTVTIQ